MDPRHLGKLRLVIIQATPFCNINCNYCYLPNRTDRRVITLDTVKAISSFLRDVPKPSQPLSVVWHAGEPLVVKRSFYEQAFEILNQESCPFRHNFQTNGTLIDDEWCEFFRSHNVQIGLSLDGPRRVHDARRQTRSGKGTFDQVMVAIRKLNEHHINFSVIAVITPELLAAMDETIAFFASLNVARLAFNVEEVEGSHTASTLFQSQLHKQIGFFYAKLAALQRAQPNLSVRELDSVRGHLHAPPGAAIERSTNLVGGIINFDFEGNVSTFSPELLGLKHPKYGRVAWANAHRGRWADLLDHPSFQKAQRDILSGIDRCATACGYFSLCGGGDPSNKLAEHGTFDATETQCCRLHLQAVADVVIAETEAQVGLAATPF
jgi:uncharacterized protein